MLHHYLLCTGLFPCRTFLHAHVAPCAVLGESISEHEWVRPSDIKDGNKSADSPELAVLSPHWRAGEGSLTVLGREEAVQGSIDLRKIIIFRDLKYIFHYVHELFQRISISFIQLIHSCIQQTYIEEQSSLVTVLLSQRCTVFKHLFSCLKEAGFS